MSLCSMFMTRAVALDDNPPSGELFLKSLCFALLASSVVVAASAQDAAPVTVAARFHVGDSWVYRLTKDPDAPRQIGFSVTAVSAAGDEPTLTTKRGSPFSVHAAPINQDFIKFPLQVGNKWPFKFNYKDQGTWDIIDIELDGEVSSFQRVKVEAGVFDAYQIVLNGYWNNRTYAANGVSGRMRIEAWYAPAAKRFVLRETKSYDWQTKALIYSEKVEATLVKVDQ